MTPKEKANELFSKYIKVETNHLECGQWMSSEGAKQCALIACQEISMTNPTIKGTSTDLVTMIVQTKAYWIQVEQEISLL